MLPFNRAARSEKRLPQVVLVADDNDKFRHELRPVLENAGYHVLEASAIDDAVEIMSEQRVDLLLVDLVMPGLNGMELLREMRRREVPHVRTIAMTGPARLDPGVKPVLRTLGVSKFLAKPLEIELLLRAIAGGWSTVRSRRYAPPPTPDPRARANHDRRPIVGWEGRYEITRAGEVWSVRERQYVKQGLGADGAPCVRVSIRGYICERDIAAAVKAAFGKNV